MYVKIPPPKKKKSRLPCPYLVVPQLLWSNLDTVILGEHSASREYRDIQQTRGTVMLLDHVTTKTSTIRR